MTPEEKARVKIDQLFEDAGWKVVDRDQQKSDNISKAVAKLQALMATIKE